MLSEYFRCVNTSAAFAQQDRGLQFLLGKRVFSRLFYPWSLVVTRLPASLVVQTSLSRHTCPAGIRVLVIKVEAQCVR